MRRNTGKDRHSVQKKSKDSLKRGQGIQREGAEGKDELGDCNQVLRNLGVILRLLMCFINVVLWSYLHFRISFMVCAWVGENV